MLLTTRPKLSVVVIAHDMSEQLPRTLVSLSPEYQRDIGPNEYEVVVVDNGSHEPVRVEDVAPGSKNVRVLRLDNGPPSPCRAMNIGLRVARGDVIGMMIDGAHLLTPGVLHFALAGTGLAERAVVATTAWSLGYDSIQTLALESGYDQSREESLLEQIGWPSDGYRLFEIAAPAVTSVDGWLQPIDESNALFLRRELWEELGGVDERFDLPGGGFVNLDLLRRAMELPGARSVALLGEGTFHQLHGDLAARASPAAVRERVAVARQQYESLRNRPWATPVPPGGQTYVGQLPKRKPALLHFVRSAVEPVTPRGHPLGASFDLELWAMDPPEGPDDPAALGLIELAQREFRAKRQAAAAAVCALARSRVGDQPELMRILSLSSSWRNLNPLPAQVAADVHVALGEAHELFGESAEADAEYREALGLSGNAVRAHMGLSRVRMPGPGYTSHLGNLHRDLVPDVYLEIGVASGSTLRLARAPTVAIGVDPEPSFAAPLSTETHIFALTSDEFFERDHLTGLLRDRPVAMAFIDGLHHFEQALRDFANVEAACAPGSIVLIHDTVPLDEVTQRRERQTTFWTGDVWKLAVCLRECRPDLNLFTITTAPAGLTVVTGLDPSSDLIKRTYDSLVAKYMSRPYSYLEADPGGILNFMPNDSNRVLERLSTQMAASPRSALT